MSVGTTQPWRKRFAFLTAIAFAALPLHAEDVPQDVVDRLQKAFRAADADGDQKLSLAEFLAGKTAPAIAKRDFRLSDFDGDGNLTIGEFQVVPGVVPPQYRSPLPDIIENLVEQTMRDLDTTYGWDKDPKAVHNANLIVTGLAQQLEAWGGGWVSTDAHEVCDPESNGRLTRNKARRYIEICYGVRNPKGDLLRQPNGLVADWMRFEQGDFSGDRQWDQREFQSFVPAQTANFAEWDRDGKGAITFPEWIAADGFALTDPVADFCRMDTNLDASLDRAELLAGVPPEMKAIAGFQLPAFDWDEDGVLSLREYRTTPVANPVWLWHLAPLDLDDDGKLSFGEFQDKKTRQWPLLRMLYFQRLDRNQDKKLDASEWFLRKKVPSELFIMNADGTGWRSFWRSEEYRNCYGPAVSPDGHWLAFSASKKIGEPPDLLVMPMNGGPTQRMKNGGNYPAWSPDSRSLACVTPYSDPRATWNIEITPSGQPGKERRLAEGGQSVQYSHDGRRLAIFEYMSGHLLEPEASDVRALVETGKYQWF